MSKITKKQLHNGWHCHDTEIIKMKKELRELKQSVLRLEKLTDEKLLDEPEPQLKQLDQSVFDGLDEKWRFAAVDKNGTACKFTNMPNPQEKYEQFMYDDTVSGNEYEIIARGYDASDWQNSLIERESSELTGSELCKAMLARGDKYVMCAYDNGYDNHPKAISISEYGDLFYINGDCKYGVLCGNIYPINNQGEPLTQAEAGL